MKAKFLVVMFVFIANVTMLTSCTKDVVEPVVQVTTPDVVDPIKTTTYTVVATGELVKFSPESTTVEKDGTAKFEAKAINTLVEADYFEFKGIKTPMKSEDSIVSLEKINEDSKVFVKFKYKEIANLLSNKDWEFYSYQIEDKSPIIQDDQIKKLGTLRLDLNGTRSVFTLEGGVVNNPANKWKLISKDKKDDTIGLWFDNNTVVEKTIIELTDKKLVLSELQPDVSLGKYVRTYSTYYAK